MSESSHLENSASYDVTQCKKRYGRGHNKETDAASAGFNSTAQSGGDLLLIAESAGHGRQFSYRNRHAEQTNGQQIKILRIGKRRQGTRGKITGKKSINVAAQLHHTPADEYRAEVADDHPDVLVGDAESQPQFGNQPEHNRKLNEKL